MKQKERWVGWGKKNLVNIKKKILYNHFGIVTVCVLENVLGGNYIKIHVGIGVCCFCLFWVR